MMTQRISRGARPAVAAALLGWSCGGAARAQEPPPSGPTPMAIITLLAGGDFLVGGTQLKLTEVPARLKALGIGTATPVRVEVPANTPTNTLKAIAGKLAASGYRLVVFTPPKRVEVSVGRPQAQKPPPPR